jgi:hypothetical protein
MSNEECRVIVTCGATAHACVVHHRDFPEVRSDGEDPKTAAGHLANALTRALDSALTDWRRESLNQAIADVREFAGQAD